MYPFSSAQLVQWLYFGICLGAVLTIVWFRKAIERYLDAHDLEDGSQKGCDHEP